MFRQSTNDRMEAHAMLYVGVDLHRKRSVVAALNDQGELMLSRRIASRPEDFQRVFGELEPSSLSVVFEATYGWHWFADLLADAGIEAHMAHPLATKAISAGRVKNDSVDARTLAHLLRTHLLPEAWIAPPPVRERRRLARTRTSLAAHPLAPALPGARHPRRSLRPATGRVDLRSGRPALPRERGAPGGRPWPRRRGPAGSLTRS